VAAATSTGGMTFKLPGRVGDSPLIGSGTYADDALGAVSCTGHGETIIRVVLAKAACDRLKTMGAQAAGDEAIALLQRVRGEAGLIIVRPDGDFGLAFNTQYMARAWACVDGRTGSAVLREG
jgi:L-asparaginase / beta-aspartyl-peptidase